MAIRNRLNRRIGSRFDRFDPNAIDADGDGRVQDATTFERPAMPRTERGRSSSTQGISGSMASQAGMFSIDDLAEIAKEQGWTIETATSGHPIFVSPKGKKFFTSGTPSDIRSYKNFASELRRAGLVIPRKKPKPKSQRNAFALEAVKATLPESTLSEALRFAAATNNVNRKKLSLDEMAEILDIDDDELKAQLRDAINEKYPKYFDDTPLDVEEDGLTNRERRRRKLPGSMSSNTPKNKRDKHIDIVGEGIVQEAEAAGVSLDAILDDSDMDTDVSWSSNSWSFSKTKKQEAGDAIIVRTNDDGEQEVLMIRRKTAPFTDGFTLPGGLLDEGETLEQTVDREMEEEVGIPANKADKRRYLGEIEARDWDPRFVEGVRVGGTRYDVPKDTDVTAASDARSAEWVSVNDLASGKYRIGFGHAGWLALAFEDDTELSRKFDILARASRHRNQRIIREVNKKRKEAGEKLFSRLGSPNKHYVPEGSGPLGMRKINNLAADLGKVVTRNPGFFDKETEEMFIHRATHSSAETAAEFGITEQQLDERLLKATRDLEVKIRADIAQKIEDAGRKKKDTKLSGAMRADGKTIPGLGQERILKAATEFDFNERQKSALLAQIQRMNEIFRNGEVYDRPIHDLLDDQRQELLDSIKITTAAGGLPMIIAKPNPVLNAVFTRQRDWASIELPSKDSMERAVELIIDGSKNNNRHTYNLDGFYRLEEYLRNYLDDIKKQGGDKEVDWIQQGLPSSGYTSWIQEYYISLLDPYRSSVFLEGPDGIHDAFGHYGIGRAYDRHGEWANYLAMKDLIELGPVEMTPEEKESAHRYWFSNYGIGQFGKTDTTGYGLELSLGQAQFRVIDYEGSIYDILEIIDSGKNGLPAKSSGKMSGSISRGKTLRNSNFKKIADVSVQDSKNKIITRRSRSSSLMGAMGIYDSDAELGQYIDELKKMMGDDWDGPNGDKVKRASENLFKIDISQEERDRLIDDLLDIEVVYSDIYDDELYRPSNNDSYEDTFDYEAEAETRDSEDWRDYLDYLKRTDPQEYEYWMDYERSLREDRQPTLWDTPIDERAVPPVRPSSSKKSKRKFFGRRRKKLKPTARINQTKFYGSDHMKQKQKDQLDMFENWKSKKDWKGLHNAHYDWWAFPIDRGSAAYGDGYNVAGNNINALKNDKEYISNLKKMASIYAEAMGWDLEKGEWLTNLDWDKGQDPYAQAYGARLYKIARSLQIFELTDEFDSFFTMVQSLRTDDGLRRRIGKSQYWDNPDVPFNNMTPGSRRAQRKLRNEIEKRTQKNNKLSGSMAARKPQRIIPSKGSARSGAISPLEKRQRFFREIDIDNWFIFIDDMRNYFDKAKNKKVKPQDFNQLMQAMVILESLDAVPTDDNGISIDMSDEEVKRLRLLLKTMTNLDDFFNISEIYNALPTKERPKTIDAGGPNV